MKKILTIRGNLLLINVVVVGLILWLAISFLIMAVSQRGQAVLLQEGMKNEQNISNISEALAYERQVFSEYLNTSGLASEADQQRVQTVTRATDEKLRVLYEVTERLISTPDFISRIPATRSSIKIKLDSLKQYQDLLKDQRSHALAQRKSTDSANDPFALSTLHLSQSGLQESLARLAKTLKYLPDFDAASIETHYSLLNEILQINVDLTTKRSMLGGVFTNRKVRMPVSRFHLAKLNERITQRFKDTARLAQASGMNEQLYSVAVNLQQFYLSEYRLHESKIDSAAVSSKWEPLEQADWFIITSKLTQLINDLTAATHDSIEHLAIKSFTRATRNLIIDVILVFLCFSITLASVLINRRVKKLAYHDGLTNLANRMNFESTLKSMSTSASHSHAVIFIDLDRFKSINDNYGHAIGDELLIEVARRLKEICKPADLLARLGGDEFAVLVHCAASEEAVEKLATDLVNAVERVITIRELNLKVGASAGLCIAPTDCAGGVELLKNADIAMYHCKSNKLGTVFRFNQSIAINHQQRLALELDLKKGLENNEFHLVYQPKVCTATGEVKSVEALLRWSHPTRGLVSPVHFIPVAEETGLMGHIGFWALNEACRELSELQKNTSPNLQMAVNISPQQFGDEHFVEHVCAAVDQHGLSYSNLTLEVTESIVMNDVTRVIQMLKNLQNLGIDIAVDDFGTGYSSLQYLQQLPLNTLKIDRAFITALDDSGADRSVANLIVQLAALFNLETVAEGVETIEQEAQIRALGVNHIQGYLYSKPVSAAELPDVIVAIGHQVESAGWNEFNRAA